MQTTHEEAPLTYLIRLLAYLLILVAIADKNWPRSKTTREGTAKPPS